MFVLLPVAFWVLIIFLFARIGMGRREVFLSASIVWGILLTLITELLSLFGDLTREWIAFSWAGVTLLSIFVLLVSAKKNRSPSTVALSNVEKGFCGGIVFFILVTLLTALLAPPNNWDSMTYHMGRVVHWLQNRSVEHYPSHIVRQLELNPWAEFAITHFQALSGGDRFANLIQWFSMVGSILGVTSVAAQLGARFNGQLFAAILTASIPMGILQASSTQNDYVVAFWLLCFVWSGLRLKKERRLLWALAAGGSLGLAILTKGTAYLYAFPFVLWFGWGVLKEPFRRTVLLGFGLVLPVLLLNAGHYSRNWALFSNPFLSGDTPTYSNEVLGPGTILSNVVRNTAIHFATPFKDINRHLEGGVEALHDFLGMDINDERTTFGETKFEIPRLNPHEDLSGNLLHTILAAITLGLVFCRKFFRRLSTDATSYVLGVTAGFLLFCIMLKWQPWVSRLHLSLFVLGAPAIGAVFERFRQQGLALAIITVQLIAALPWAFWNMSRPLANVPESIFDILGSEPLQHQTILKADRTRQYFINKPDLRKSFIDASRIIRENGAAPNIGLKMAENDWEYPLWVLLRNLDGNGPRIEHIDVENGSGAIGLKNFHADLIVEFDKMGHPAVKLP